MTLVIIAVSYFYQLLALVPKKCQFARACILRCLGVLFPSLRFQNRGWASLDFAAGVSGQETARQRQWKTMLWYAKRTL